MEKYFSIQQYQPGEVIFSEGDAAKSVFVIFNGQVEIRKKYEGQSIIVTTLNKNEMFGEMALIDGAPRSATVIASEPTECFVMDVKDFHERMESLDPLLRNVFNTLVTRLRTTTNLLANKTSLPVV